MWWENFRDSNYYQLAISFGVFLIAVLIGLVAFIAMRFTANRLRSRTPGGIGALVVYSLRAPAIAFIVFLGALIALRAVPGLSGWQDDVTKTWNVIVILLVARAISSTSRVTITWYIDTIAPRTRTNFDDQALRLVRRVLRVLIYGIAALLVVDALGQSISPILGGLGISGLAVALALQPTLTNFFAGTYVMSDGAIRPGDYIELNSGPAGYVIDVGWRTTKIRTWWNTLVIIPNGVMADSTITNYQGPDPAINVVVSGGVSYSSDLARVEEVSLEVSRQVIADNDEAVKAMTPWFGFDAFGDSNVSFWIFLQAKDRIGGFVVTSDLIKRIHARFLAEGIEINYPVRKLIFENDQRPETVPPRTSPEIK